MPQHLVTPTLLDKMEFALNAPPSWKVRAEEGLVRAVRREYSDDMPDWVAWGNQFEQEVYKHCRRAEANGFGEVIMGSDNFNKVCNMCIGGSFQTTLKSTVKGSDDIDVVYYGKTDVQFPNKIIDIKTTANYRGSHKYKKGWQHKFYSALSNIKDFEYIVAEWESEHVPQVAAVYTIALRFEQFELDNNKVALERAHEELVSFLRAKGLYEDYFFKFSNNDKR